VLTWVSRAVFAFMFVNGAIVFAHGFGRVLGVAAVLVAAGAWLRTWKGPRPAQV
jgi:hypothetical protein